MRRFTTFTIAVVFLACGAPLKEPPPAPVATAHSSTNTQPSSLHTNNVHPARDGGIAEASPPEFGGGSGEVRVAPGEVARDGWRVRVTGWGGSTTSETWPSLSHAWHPDSPREVTAEGTICLPKGNYVIEESSMPSLNMDISVRGTSVLHQTDFPTEISKPIAIDGCVEVRARLGNPLHFKSIGFQVNVRPARTSPPCDSTSFPKNQWNVCLYQGRNQEELIGTQVWTKLAPVTGQQEGRNGQFDWLSMVAQSTQCFAKGTYTLHTRSHDTITVFIDGAKVLDAPPTRSQPVMEARPLALDGCKQVRVIHSYKFGYSELDVAWARVGSPEDRTWGIERACQFRCDEASVCTDGKKLEDKPQGSICVPHKRKSHQGEYCDAQHPCVNSWCIRNRCFED